MKARGRHFEHKKWKHKLGITDACWTALWVERLQSEDMNDAICTCMPVCHVLIHYLHCCTELKFTVQQLSLNVLYVFYLQLQSCNCSKFHINQFRSVWDILQNRRGVFSEHNVERSLKPTKLGYFFHDLELHLELCQFWLFCHWHCQQFDHRSMLITSSTNFVYGSEWSTTALSAGVHVISISNDFTFLLYSQIATCQ